MSLVYVESRQGHTGKPEVIPGQKSAWGRARGECRPRPEFLEARFWITSCLPTTRQESCASDPGPSKAGRYSGPGITAANFTVGVAAGRSPGVFHQRRRGGDGSGRVYARYEGDGRRRQPFARDAAVSAERSQEFNDGSCGRVNSIPAPFASRSSSGSRSANPGRARVPPRRFF